MFTYGLNIFIAPSTIVLPPAEAAPAAPRTIRVPKGSRLSKPIAIDVVQDGPHESAGTVIVAGEGSEATIVEHLRSTAGAGTQTRTSSVEIIAGPGSRVTHISVQNFGSGMHAYAEKRAAVGRDASVTWLECCFGSAFNRSHISTRLEGEGSSVAGRTVFFGQGRQQFDLYAEAVHAAPRTSSDLAGRGALDGDAKTIYRGLISIGKGMAGCTGMQKEHTLLLSETAEIDAVPNLEIGCDDVRCGHAAAAGGLDQEQVFYLRSRGLDEATARKALVEGFFAPVIAEMKDSGLEEVASCIIAERLYH